MITKRAEGFLFDVHEGGDTVVLWLYQDDETLLRLEADFHPRIYARARRPILISLGRELVKRGLLNNFRLTEGVEFWSGKMIEVGEYTPRQYKAKQMVVARLATRIGEAALYNADLAIPQYYLYANDLFPLCRLEAEYVGDRIHEVRCLSSLWETDYKVPPFRVLELRLGHSKFIPLEQGNSLLLHYDGRTYELEPRTRRELLEIINDALRKWDPDVILSDYGDERIFPFLIKSAKQEKMMVSFDRDSIPTERAVVLDGKSYISYGRILYKPPSYICYGRWHIDLSNSFISAETGLDGLIELSRLSRLPPQKVARTTPGTAMNSIECYHAFKNKILIPYQKAEPEKYKTAWDLLVGDKGGLTYMQPVGAFENVAEIDYASMYPSLMMKKNLSPETVRCSCCSNARVPETNYNVCEKREGLLPQVLKPILELRRAYKQLKKNTTGKQREIYDQRQHALKWLLVTAFGFTGYRNARFGRIECHEATTAWGRELLLKAKEVAEGRRFRLLHALTDSLWITKPSLTQSEVLDMCEEITRLTGIEMTLEGLYRWIVFLPSKENSQRGVACRFFGRFQKKEMKLRGLTCRRHDAPEFVREAQKLLLDLFMEAKTLHECREKIPAAQALLASLIEDLANGRVDRASLLINRRLSKEPDAYKVNTMSVEAAHQLSQAHIKLHPGEQIKYLVLNSRPPLRSSHRLPVNQIRVLAEAFVENSTSYDVEYYKDLLQAAAEEIFRF